MAAKRNRAGRTSRRRRQREKLEKRFSDRAAGDEGAGLDLPLVQQSLNEGWPLPNQTVRRQLVNSITLAALDHGGKHTLRDRLRAAKILVDFERANIARDRADDPQTIIVAPEPQTIVQLVEVSDWYGHRPAARNTSDAKPGPLNGVP